MKSSKSKSSKSNVEQWGLLLMVCALLAGTLALLPMPAQAATTFWGPGHMFGRSDNVLPGFWVTGEVSAVEEASVTLQLPNHHHARGMMRYVSLQVTLDVISDTILLDETFAPLTLTTLQEGDEVVVSPRLVWGNLVAQLLYKGDPEDLADAGYRGTLVEEDGDTLTLKNRRDGEFTVMVDENTIWYDGGPMPRPTDLPDDLTLRVLGTATENDEGDEIIHAILITP
ncbi:MAG: hypothetical protein IT328_08100 [Caldilineaceae bacterium]|nr:hypothetical protein [Caldilineaceae bacterium]